MKKSELKKGMSKTEIDSFVHNALIQMTLKEKVNILTGNTPFPQLIFDMVRHRYNSVPYTAGGVKRLDVPAMKFSDGPRGVVMGKSTCFPVSMARGASWDIELEEKIGEAIAREIRSLGGSYYGGVCINLLRHPAWGRAQETYGEDSHHLGEMGAALVRGVQKHNVMACVKHYALNSMENARFKIDVQIDERALREVYLAHFKRCIEEGAASVMAAYNKMWGEQCCESSYLLTKILRDEWKFDGFVISDFVHGIRDRRKAVEAGCDIEMPFAMHYGKKLIKSIKNGEIEESKINLMVKRVITKIIEFESSINSEVYRKKNIPVKEHAALAHEAALKSITLLKNDNSILPLKKEQIKKIALLGNLATVKNIGDHGSSMVHPSYVITPCQGFSDYLGKNVEIKTCKNHELEKAKTLAANSDAVVIITGCKYSDEGEYITDPGMRGGGDRDMLSLHEDEITLIQSVAAVNSNTVVVLVGGSAILAEEWKDKVPAIVMQYYSGQEGGLALAEIIFGEHNPSGKLPFVVPKRTDDLPFFDKEADSIEYGYYHGYTLLDKKEIEPAWPFGFGLSYTEYEYSALSVKQTGDDIIAAVDVKNKGSRDGEEVVQLYIGFKKSAVDRPVRALKGFSKVLLNAGEKKTVTITVPKLKLAYYDESSSSWIKEKTDCIVYAGPCNSERVLLSQGIKV